MSPQSRLTENWSYITAQWTVFSCSWYPSRRRKPERLETGQVGPSSPDFTKDGNSVIFSAWTGGKQNIDRIPLNKGQNRTADRLSIDKRGIRLTVQRSPAFTWLRDPSITALRSSPLKAVHLLRRSTFPLAQLGTRGPVWTPDGTQITYIVNDGEKADLWAQPVSGGDPSGFQILSLHGLPGENTRGIESRSLSPEARDFTTLLCSK